MDLPEGTKVWIATPPVGFDIENSIVYDLGEDSAALILETYKDMGYTILEREE